MTSLPSSEKDADAKRREELSSLCIVDTAPEEIFDDITELVCEICDAKIAMINLLDADRFFTKSIAGKTFPTPKRKDIFCAYAVLGQKIFIIPDTLLDDRFSKSQLVIQDPKIRFYAGFPLFLKNGVCIGTLCLMDSEPRTLTFQQLTSLARIARQLMFVLEVRRSRPPAA